MSDFFMDPEQYKDNTVSDAKPGIVSGFTPVQMFEPIQGDGWKAILFQFEGPLPKLRDQIFLNSKEDMIARVVQNPPDKDNRTPEEIGTERFNKRMKTIYSILNMYLSAYYPKGDNSWAAKLPKFKTPDEALQGIRSYLDACKASLPENYGTMELDIILGRGEGDTYLSTPNSTKVTGRYVKRSNDETRELVLSSIFKRNYMHDIQSNSSTPTSGNTSGAAQADSSDWF